MGSVEFLVIVAALSALIGQNVDNGGASVELHSDFLRWVTEEDFAGILLVINVFERHRSHRSGLLNLLL